MAGCAASRDFMAATCWIWAASRWVSSRCWAEPQFGLLAGGIDEAVDVFLERLEPGFVGEEAVLHMGGGRRPAAERHAGFEAGDPLLESFEMATDDDFADALDRLGRIEG